jgi:hypothetical protein
VQTTLRGDDIQTHRSDLRIRFATVSPSASKSAILLAGLGLTGALAWYAYDKSALGMVDRPEASGAIGAVRVYGQNAAGGFRIFPGRLAVLKRPQHLAFELHVEGRGPRSIYIELDVGLKKWRMFNKRIQAPKTNWYLEYVMDLDDNVPDNIAVIVRVDAPHARAIESTFPIRLLRADPG